MRVSKQAVAEKGPRFNILAHLPQPG